MKKNKYGIFNICSNERITKFKFGIKLCDIFRLNKKLIQASYLNKRSDIVKRPFNMALNNKKLKKIINIKIPSINHHIKIMKKDFINFQK